MTRLEELACKLADDDLSAADVEELDQLLAGEPQVAREFFALLDVEVILRGERTRIELTRPILKAIEREREDRMQRGVIREIKKQIESGVRPAPAPAPVAEAAVIKPPPRPRVRAMPRRMSKRSAWGHWMNAAVAAGVLLAIGVWVLWPKPPKPGDSTAAGQTTRHTTDKQPPKTAAEMPKEEPAPVIKEAGTDKTIFEEDFAKGIPEGWLCGKLDSTDLPAGAKTAMRQIVKPNVNHFGIYSQRLPAPGLSDLTRDDVFHFTFKAGTRDDYRLILHVQEAADPNRGGQLSFDIINDRAGWRTIDAPIAKFHGATQLGDKKAVLLGYQFETTPVPDVGLVISHIWITRPQSKERAPP